MFAITIALLVLALAGCSGNLRDVHTGPLAPGEAARFHSFVNKVAADAGLRSMPMQEEIKLTYPGDESMSAILTHACKYQPPGKSNPDLAMELRWNSKGDLYTLDFPDDGSLEPVAVKIVDFSIATFGKDRVAVGRYNPFVDTMLQDF